MSKFKVLGLDICTISSRTALVFAFSWRPTPRFPERQNLVAKSTDDQRTGFVGATVYDCNRNECRGDTFWKIWKIHPLVCHKGKYQGYENWLQFHPNFSCSPCSRVLNLLFRTIVIRENWISDRIWRQFQMESKSLVPPFFKSNKRFQHQPQYSDDNPTLGTWNPRCQRNIFMKGWEVQPFNPSPDTWKNDRRQNMQISFKPYNSKFAQYSDIKWLTICMKIHIFQNVLQEPCSRHQTFEWPTLAVVMGYSLYYAIVLEVIPAENRPLPCLSHGCQKSVLYT